MINGKIVWYDFKKGFGLIKSNADSKEYFLHKTNIKKSPKFIKENDSAKFEVKNINNKVIAINCIIFNNNKGKIKNTTDFTPNMNEGDLHVVFTNNKCPNKIYHNDVLIIHNFLDKRINYLENIMNEIKSKEIFKLWHGDSHFIADDKGYDWKSESKTFQTIINYISKFFNMDIKATRLNYYKDSNDWKPYHHDAAAIKKDKALTQNFTVAVNIGLTRTVSLQHATHGTIVDFEIGNCECYAFSDKTNVIWKHGIRRDKDFKDEPRLSIIAWGKI